jgi:FMN phosphatase YigB (HAD superfamily)
MRYPVLLFDLFGTVVLFKPQVPVLEVANTQWRSTLGWLRTDIARALPEVPFEDFLHAMTAVTAEIVRARPPEYLEVPSRERFRRTLERIGLRGPVANAAAEALCVRHMGFLAESTVFPPEHGALLRALAGRHRLGLISNFDHGPTGHAILARHGIADLFEVTLISADVGRRKPHPAIFHEALGRMRVAPEEVLFVGDNVADDVAGARATGIDVAWISDGAPPPAGGPAPTHVIARLTDLDALLADG